MVLQGIILWFVEQNPGIFTAGCFLWHIQVWNSTMDWPGSFLHPCDPEDSLQAPYSRLLPGSAPSGMAGEGKLQGEGAGGPCQGTGSYPGILSCFSLCLLMDLGNSLSATRGMGKSH